MKDYFQKLAKKPRGKEKSVFLFCNAILLVAIMISVWSVYTSANSQMPLESDVVVSFVDSTTASNTKVTIPTESTIDVTYPTDVTEPLEVTPTDPMEDITLPAHPETVYPIEHIVTSGESWYSISKKYFDKDIYASALAYLNEKGITDYIYIGETIIIESEEYLIEITETLKNIKDDNSNKILTFLKGKYGYSYGTRPNPAIDITVSEDSNGRNYTEEVDTSNFEYAGEHKITGYDPYCTHCCSGTGLMASGVYAVNGYSVAAGIYPIGTTLYIEGYGFYVVEDRGVSGKHIDIAAPSHEACYALTASNVRVYIVPNNN